MKNRFSGNREPFCWRSKDFLTPKCVKIKQNLQITVHSFRFTVHSFRICLVKANGRILKENIKSRSSEGVRTCRGINEREIVCGIDFFQLENYLGAFVRI